MLRFKNVCSVLNIVRHEMQCQSTIARIIRKRISLLFRKILSLLVNDNFFSFTRHPAKIFCASVRPDDTLDTSIAHSHSEIRHASDGIQVSTCSPRKTRRAPSGRSCFKAYRASYNIRCVDVSLLFQCVDVSLLLRK